MAGCAIWKKQGYNNVRYINLPPNDLAYLSLLSLMGQIMSRKWSLQVSGNLTAFSPLFLMNVIIRLFDKFLLSSVVTQAKIQHSISRTTCGFARINAAVMS